ncbi:DnaJ-domain-containing protein [Rhizophagus irregularis]|uniref:DnaJ-domain-containing protein n=1 Tax=Rhizophagus irregularis TaxID=588596 RepID=A0A2I1GGV8_9GLOM|nr:DnaJ-domain-containing protein [Rhizophagus irregularis]
MMNLHTELGENERQFKDGKINENEYNTRHKSLLNGWIDGPMKTKKIEPACVVNKPKKTDLYEILQLEPDATKVEISSSYRKLAMKYHPDKDGSIEIEEWGKLAKAYQILSDDNSRSLYDNYGIIRNSGKASFNSYVGGDLWQPYIGNLEIGLWLSTLMDNNELENLVSIEQAKEHRHTFRVSSIVRYLQVKLSRFPEQDNSSQEDYSQFLKSLHEEARKLYDEPNGKELLFSLGEIYISEAGTYLNKFSTDDYFSILKVVEFFVDLLFGYFELITKNKPNLEEINKLAWKLSLSEISSIAHETCEKVLNDENLSEAESYHLAKSMRLMGEVWLEVSKL